MSEGYVTVKIWGGLLGEAACKLTQLAGTFKSNITIEKTAYMGTNAEFLVGVLSLNIRRNSYVKIVAEGPDEKEAVEILCGFLDTSKIV